MISPKNTKTLNGMTLDTEFETFRDTFQSTAR